MESRSDGTFSLKDVPPGQYRLTLVRGGFVGTHSSDEPTKLTVFNGQVPEALHLHMMRGPAISGRIFDEGGKSKASAHVELLRMDFRSGQQTMVASDISMVTDKNGEYRLPGLPAGEYYLRVRPRVGGKDFQTVYFPESRTESYATPITVREGADISGIDLSLTRGNLHSVRLKVDIASPAPLNPELSFYITPEAQWRERRCGSSSVPYSRAKRLCQPAAGTGVVRNRGLPSGSRSNPLGAHDGGSRESRCRRGQGRYRARVSGFGGISRLRSNCPSAFVEGNFWSLCGPLTGRSFWCRQPRWPTTVRS